MNYCASLQHFFAMMPFIRDEPSARDGNIGKLRVVKMREE